MVAMFNRRDEVKYIVFDETVCGIGYEPGIWRDDKGWVRGQMHLLLLCRLTEMPLSCRTPYADPMVSNDFIIACPCEYLVVRLAASSAEAVG